MAWENSQGVEFKFNNVTYTATQIAVSRSFGEFNVTSLNIATGATCIQRFRAGGLRNTEIKVDWIGNTLPPTDKAYAIVFGGAGAASGTGLMDGDPLGSAIATGVTITAQAGDLIKGSATFKLSKD
jgi:hypothetical protein